MSIWKWIGCSIVVLAQVGQIAPRVYGQDQTPESTQSANSAESTSPSPSGDSSSTPEPLSSPSQEFSSQQNNSPFARGGQASSPFAQAGQTGFQSSPVGWSAPNMFGDSLRGFRSVSFFYNGAGDFSPVISAGSTTLRNSSVSENNSAIPRTRLSFRYNYFKNAVDVQGFRLSPETVPVDNFDFLNNGQPPGADIPLVFPSTKSYDAQFYTLAFEQTFLEDLASLEFRLPIATTLDSSQTFQGVRELAGTGAPPGVTTFNDNFNDIPVNVPPGAVPLLSPSTDVLGRTDTELQDLTWVLKGILHQSANHQILVSGGFATTAPLARDVNITAVDAYDDDQNFEPLAMDPTLQPPFNTLSINAFNSSNFGSATNIRRREIHIKNEIWEVAPFLAVAAAPTDRSFFNGFLQVSLPLNSAEVTYRERRVDIVARDIFPNAVGINTDGQQFGPNGSEGDFRQRGKINEQALLQLDVGRKNWQ
ncbi:MAG: hypothetical protein KDA84_19625 [Planctomycetaceae bacterium]|nr:hypothetical protein [Planctomycetaceae bacterium]